MDKIKSFELNDTLMTNQQVAEALSKSGVRVVHGPEAGYASNMLCINGRCIGSRVRHDRVMLYDYDTALLKAMWKIAKEVDHL